ncbi:MAG TPA: hypothetical protein PLV92_29180, partial [Pirellulaceae bacterium]|nr:hypothetical protein [Pirellulaceae bacterium]
PAIAYDTTIGIGRQAVPATAVSNLVATYFDSDTNELSPLDDWRGSRTVAGSRAESNIDRQTTSWGVRADVGLTGGSDEDWNYFSVQWDGQITITHPGTHLYLWSDDGSQLLIDANQDGSLTALDSLMGGLLDNQGGSYGEYRSSPSITLGPGTYSFRMQMHEWSGSNIAQLAWDDGQAINDAQATQLWRFNGVAGQSLYFDSQYTDTQWWNSWQLWSPGGQNLFSNYQGSDQILTLPYTGEYVISVRSETLSPALPYKFRIVTPEVFTNSLTYGTVYDGTLTEKGERHVYEFDADAGDRLQLDILNATPNSARITIDDPTGRRLVDTSGTYDSYSFRVLTSGRHVVQLWTNDSDSN